jgi:predicted DNA-binding transcriptional regulator AlpA
MSRAPKSPRPVLDLNQLLGVTLASAIEPMLRINDLPRVLGVSRRTIERLRSASRFPPPDLHIGKMPLWKAETIQRWIDSGGKGVS